MPEDIKILKTIAPSECPHCGKNIFVNYQMMPPSLVSIVKDSEIKEAKEDFLTRIEEIKFNDEKQKDGIINWVNDANTLFTLQDVEEMTRNILLDQTQPVAEK